ncbi:glycoside hydrolase family 16 protein [Gelidibacter japonicus]|uniref:glycoside hydrolase family 16 protein n=1 Tax=Gelidibacter japonicus TaxID=1962232 RepID=UPI00202008A1|nr:glycoside hydrolase family 16 protein [Gelidibacter japonicus]MCL8006946.1 glycoside hydrolase family 16 protein [Gelidibacter japonicus]
MLEEFDKPGKPTSDKGFEWSFVNDINPNQQNWEDFVPGDGYAHITIDSDVENDTDETFPFQTIAFKHIGPGHRLEMSAKGIAVPGVGGFIFTYNEDTTFDEIDIEIVPIDTQTSPEGHPIDPPNGWTDARFNSWSNSSVIDYKPEASFKKPVVDNKGRKISLRDDKFHTYTIDWLHFPGGDGRDGRIDFYIDNVLQQTITFPVPDGPSSVIMGFRQMSWTGALDWPGTQTMLIDWVKIETIDPNNK